jgi:hypothetical protein
MIGMGKPLAARQDSPAGVSGARARAIEGVWEPTVTIRLCGSGVPLFPFESMDTYVPGGIYLGESASEPSRRATGMGHWRHAGGRNFTAVYQFFTYDPNGLPSGRLKVTANIELSTDGQSLTSSDTTEVMDFDGNLIEQVCGTRVARRFK